jgi:hypothetical protein
MPRQDFSLRHMAMTDNAPAAVFGLHVQMPGKKGGDFRFNRPRQKRLRPIAQHGVQRVRKASWLNQFGNVILGHGVSLLWWRSGRLSTAKIRRPPVSRRHQDFGIALGEISLSAVEAEGDIRQ